MKLLKAIIVFMLGILLVGLILVFSTSLTKTLENDQATMLSCIIIAVIGILALVLIYLIYRK